VQALKGEDITIYGDGNQTRSFCFVDDLIDGCVRLMQSPADFTGPVNLGNPDEFSMRELAQLIIEATGSCSKISFLPLPEDDPKQRQPDIALAQQRLDWSPTVRLRDGLKTTVAYFDDEMSRSRRVDARAS
jgi:UDP-glucuronate decarboxylase